MLFLLAATQGFCIPWTSTPTIKVESAPLGGLSSLSVRSEVRGASVWLDNQYRGTVPLDLSGLAPGSHVLVLKASDYYDATITLSLAADTKTTVSATLQLITGFLDLRVDPLTAEVLVDGKSYAPGTIELPAGRRELTVRRFGYTTQTFSVYIPARLFAFASVTLEKAPFEVHGFYVSRSRFNPRNAGLKGVINVAFEVSAEGSGEIRITGPDGSLVHVSTLGPFGTWEQSHIWNGRKADGTPLPDGDYTVELSLRPAAGVESASERFYYTASVGIDSSLVVTTSGSYGTMYGSVYAPEALAPASDGFRADVSGYVELPVGSGTAEGGLIISAAAELALGLDLGLGFEIHGNASSALRLGARASLPLLSPFGLAALAEGRVSAADTGNPAWARLGLALGLGNPFIKFVLMPHLGAYWEDGLSARAGCGAALAFGSYTLGAALSAEGLSGPWPATWLPFLAWPIRTALELRFSPTGLPLSLRAILGLNWSPAPASWLIGLGLSAGF